MEYPSVSWQNSDTQKEKKWAELKHSLQQHKSKKGKKSHGMTSMNDGPKCVCSAISSFCICGSLSSEVGSPPVNAETEFGVQGINPYESTRKKAGLDRGGSQTALQALQSFSQPSRELCSEGAHVRLPLQPCLFTLLPFLHQIHQTTREGVVLGKAALCS